MFETEEKILLTQIYNYLSDNFELPDLKHPFRYGAAVMKTSFANKAANKGSA